MWVVSRGFVPSQCVRQKSRKRQFKACVAEAIWLGIKSRQPDLFALPFCVVNMALDVIQTLKDLVATPSVNPMGRAVSGAEFYEYRLTAVVEKLLADNGITSKRQAIAEKRDN